MVGTRQKILATQGRAVAAIRTGVTCNHLKELTALMSSCCELRVTVTPRARLPCPKTLPRILDFSPASLKRVDEMVG